MSKQRIIAGVDIGSSKVATVIASVTEEEKKISVIGASSIESRGIRKGQIIDIEEAADVVVESIESAERMAGYNLTRALVAVSGPHLASTNSKGVVAVAEPEKEIIHEDVRRVIEAARAISLPSTREIIHVLPRYFIVDGQEGIKDPEGMSGVRLEVETHIVTGSTTAMRNLVKCVSEVGADVQSLVSSGLASAESVLTNTEKELGVILVDIGGGVTDLLVFVEGAPFYTVTLPVGGKNITNDIAIGLRLSLEEAEKLKLFLSRENQKATLPTDKEPSQSPKSSKQDDEINLKKIGITSDERLVSRKTLVDGIIKPRLNEIFNMVETELKKSGSIGLTPSGAVICGGAANTEGIIRATRQNLSLPVRVGVPKGVSGLVDDVLNPAFATPVGLALYGARHQVEGATGFSVARLGKSLPKLHVKGAAGRIIDLLKSFLP